MIKGYKDAADYLKQKGALPYSDLSNKEKRDSKSARSRKSGNVEPVKEESEKKEKEKKSPTKEKKTPTKEAGKVSPDKKNSSPGPKPRPKSPVKAVAVVADQEKENIKKEKERKKTEEEEKTKSISPTKTPSPVKGKASPAKSEGKSSPTKSEGKESPVKSEGKESPAKSEGKESPAKSESPKLDKSVGIDKSDTAVNTDVEKKQKNLSKKPSADSVLEKEDGIRTSNVSLRSEESPLTKDAETQKQGPRLRDESTSPMGGSSSKKKEDTGKYVSLEKIEPSKTEDEADSSFEGKHKKGTGRKTPKSRVGFNDNDDSGNETDPSRSRSRRTLHSTHRNKKPYIDHVRESVRMYQNKRNYSRSLNQLKRAQAHTGPMHDIVMFSKMMDNYRRGLMGDEEELDLRNYANWDGYLNGKFITVFSQVIMQALMTSRKHHEFFVIL